MNDDIELSDLITKINNVFDIHTTKELTEKLNKMFCKSDMKNKEDATNQKAKNDSGNEQPKKEEQNKHSGIVNKAKPMKNRAQIKKEAQNTYEENYDINQVQEEFDDIYEDFDE